MIDDANVWLENQKKFVVKRGYMLEWNKKTKAIKSNQINESIMMTLLICFPKATQSQGDCVKDFCFPLREWYLVLSLHGARSTKRLKFRFA